MTSVDRAYQKVAQTGRQQHHFSARKDCPTLGKIDCTSGVHAEICEISIYPADQKFENEKELRKMY